MEQNFYDPNFEQKIMIYGRVNFFKEVKFTGECYIIKNHSNQVSNTRERNPKNVALISQMRMFQIYLKIKKN
jgi:hypothetical protein